MHKVPALFGLLALVLSGTALAQEFADANLLNAEQKAVLGLPADAAGTHEVDLSTLTPAELDVVLGVEGRDATLAVTQAYARCINGGWLLELNAGERFATFTAQRRLASSNNWRPVPLDDVQAGVKNVYRIEGNATYRVRVCDQDGVCQKPAVLQLGATPCGEKVS